MSRLRDTTPRLAAGPDTSPLMAFTVPPWMDDAACGPETADLFFPTSKNPDAARDAIAICRLCPVQADCLAYANDTEVTGGRFDTVGVWGGHTEAERRSGRTQQNTCRDCGDPVAPGFTYCLAHRLLNRRATRRASEQRRRHATR